MSNKQRVPQIRFKGFTDAWEQRKLGEVASKVTEKNVQNTVTETFTNSAEFGIISQRDFFVHDIAKADKIDGYYVVQNDDFVYNPRISVTAPCGPINRNKMGRIGVMSPLYTVFRVQGISKLYLEWYFKTSNWYSYMYFNGDSGARSDRFSIKNELFFEMPLPTPCHKEQERIGYLLDDLENLITLHQRKYDRLVQIKKALLEKMFPAAGESVPAIRFRGFTDAWEQRKLGNLVDRVTRKNENMESTLPLTVSAEYGLVDQITFFNNRVASQNISGYYLLYQGDFAYNKSTSSSALWGAVKRLDLYQKGVLSTLYIVFRPKNVSSEFLLRYYETTYWHPEMIKIAAEGARNHGLLNISPVDFFGSELKVPQSSSEQDRIGYLIRTVSNLITLHQQQLQKLKNIKAALLERMFV